MLVPKVARAEGFQREGLSEAPSVDMMRKNQDTKLLFGVWAVVGVFDVLREGLSHGVP
jgi:hypothetical protein